LAIGALTQIKAQQGILKVQADKVVAPILTTMWGIFFEDINFGADGGLYAELVKNRSFEFTKPLMGWKVQGRKAVEGSMLILNRKAEHPTNPRYLRVTVDQAGPGDLGLVNEGFRGMGIKQGVRYTFSILYRQSRTGVTLHIGLKDPKGNSLGDTVLTPAETDTGWHKATATFTATRTEPKASMTLGFEGNGRIDVDMISLFPGDTWKNRPGGLRADMVQWLADMKPGFIRFPGGCIVEGFDLTNRYQWKKTVGPVADRQFEINRWNIEFPHRSTPDYFQSHGLGFFEYFQLAEDIGAEPLPILNCGMACQFNSAELVPMDQEDPYIQDALDLVEFANGDTTTRWGKLRASMGHPASFHLHMMGVGNENWGPQYIERLQAFTKAIKSRYPDLKLVNSSGTDPDGARFDYLNGELRTMHADLIDEHYYRNPDWFFANARRYDAYPRGTTHVFAGEYAAQSDHTVSPENKNCWLTALSEAAFMTGLERNADVVSMASYAPLFANIDAWQWTPDLIWVNSLQSYGTPDYYVQQLFSLNKGTGVVPLTLDGQTVAGQDSLYATACVDDATHELIIKVVNASGHKATRMIDINGCRLKTQGTWTVLQSNDLGAVNTFDQPKKVAPVQQRMTVNGKTISLAMAPYSFNILRVAMR
jgi:alpha-L-arabinofuranosidase